MGPIGEIILMIVTVLVVGSIIVILIVQNIFFALLDIDKSIRKKLNIIMPILIVFFWAFILIVPAQLSNMKDKKIQEKRYAEREAARTAAEPIFKEQCKKSGEQIYRTVENVDGVLLLKIWRGANADNDKPLYNDPQWEYAAWDVAGGKSYIGYFLNNPKNSMGYSFVDVRLDDNQIERYLGEYHGSLDGNLPDMVDTELNPIEPAQYAITFENNTDPELRKHWIAGTTFKIMDLQTNELLAEKIIFTTTNGRKYWSSNSVTHCGIDGRYDEELKNDVLQFINSVLKPREQK